MAKNICIIVKDVSKSFRIYHDKGHTLKETLIRSTKTSYEKRLVLDGINLEIEKGKTVGLIGRNGSGKSTLLKLLTGIIYADSGDISTTGKVSSLLELGAGFHPDFSGKDNIYINASIFGLSKNEIDRRYDQIVRFSELENYIDNPVRTYSSGMYMRLAFSVAINVDADILFVDEVLAVGDANFQKKCLDKIKELRIQGKTIVLVTHDLSAVEKICDEAIWLEQGRIIEQGSPKRIIDKYMLYMETEQSEMIADTNAAVHNVQKTELTSQEPKEDSDVETVAELEQDSNLGKTDEVPNVSSDNRWGNNKAVIKSVTLTDAAGVEKRLFDPDDTIKIQIEYEIKNKIDDLVIGFGIWTKDRIRCYGTNTQIDEIDTEGIAASGVIEIKLPKNRLVNNSYVVDIALHSTDGVPYDYITNAYSFNVYSKLNDLGICRSEHSWEFKRG